MIFFISLPVEKYGKIGQMVEFFSKDEIQIVVLGVIINSEGKVLLSLRRDDEINEADRKWELPGGKIEFGETAEQCLVRETKEETGLIISPVQIVNCIWTQIWKRNNGSRLQVILIPFLCVEKQRIERKGEKEVYKLNWFKEEELRKIEMLRGNDKILEIAYKQYYERFNHGRKNNIRKQGL